MSVEIVKQTWLVSPGAATAPVYQLQYLCARDSQNQKPALVSLTRGCDWVSSFIFMYLVVPVCLFQGTGGYGRTYHGHTHNHQSCQWHIRDHFSSRSDQSRPHASTVRLDRHRKNRDWMGRSVGSGWKPYSDAATDKQYVYTDAIEHCVTLSSRIGR